VVVDTFQLASQSHLVIYSLSGKKSIFVRQKESLQILMDLVPNSFKDIRLG